MIELMLIRLMVVGDWQWVSSDSCWRSLVLYCQHPAGCRKSGSGCWRWAVVEGWEWNERCWPLLRTVPRLRSKVPTRPAHCFQYHRFLSPGRFSRAPDGPGAHAPVRARAGARRVT